MCSGERQVEKEHLKHNYVVRPNPIYPISNIQFRYNLEYNDNEAYSKIFNFYDLNCIYPFTGNYVWYGCAHIHLGRTLVSLGISSVSPSLLDLPRRTSLHLQYTNQRLRACPVIFKTFSSLQTVTPLDLSTLSLIRLHCFPPHPHTDLALGFLSLGGVLVVGSFTVRAVVFTVVVGCPGVCHNQQLLDVSLKRKVHAWKWGSSTVSAV